MTAMDRVPFRCLAVAAGLLLTAALGRAQPSGEPIVVDVVPVGNALIPKDQILGQIRTRAGQRFNQAAVEKDALELRRSGAFSDVRVRTQESSPGKVLVFFDVAELPSLIQEIKYTGAKHIKQEELDNLTGLKRGTPLNPIANRLGAQRILEKLREDGRYYASVELISGGQVGDTRVEYRITEGPETRIRAIEVPGHTEWVSSARLKTQIQSGRAILNLGGKYNPKVIDADQMSLAEYYKNLGYLDARVSVEFVPHPDASNLKVVFHIYEGTRYRVGKVQINGNKVYTDDELLKLTSMREGQLYDQSVIKADLKLIEAKYGFSGRRVPVRENVIYNGPGEVTVQYEVTEAQPVRAADIHIIGNTRTRDNIILRQLGIFPGQILSWPDLQAAEQRLANLGIFEANQETGERPHIEVRDLDSPGEFKDIFVHVKETTTGTFMLGLGINSDAGLTGQIVLNERNFDLFKFPRTLDELLSGDAFRGGGQELRLEAMPGTQFQRYSASLRIPNVYDTPYSLSMSGYYYQRGFTEYSEDRVGGRFTVGRQIDRIWSVSETFRVEGVNIYNVPGFASPAIADFKGSHTLLGFRTAITRDNRDSYLRPTSGSKLDVGFEEVTGDYTFPVLTAEFSKYWSTWSRRDGSGKHVLSFRSQLSIAGDNTPVYERFYGGGFSSLRGFAFRGVGPFENGLNVGGRFSYLNTLEYQIPVLANDKFFLVGFCDAGTVEQNVEIRNYRVTVGLGFRLVTPLTGPVPIAVDFGIPLVKGPFDQKQLVAFYVGFGNF
ncbi:MAG: outer membrane protein assembly factor BamA [Gemmataceae bacterium]